MAGKKMRSRKGNSHNMGYSNYKTNGTLAENKKLKAKKHEKLLQLQKNKKTIRLKLLEDVLAKTKLNTFQLKMKFGTLNIRRLNDIYNGTYLDQFWYKNRVNNETNKKMHK